MPYGLTIERDLYINEDSTIKDINSLGLNDKIDSENMKERNDFI